MSPEQGNGADVLAVAADLMFASRIRGAAATAGAAVAFARTRQDALGRARAAHPRLILLDLDAVGVDPPELIRALKTDPGTGAVPIVAFGAHVRGEALRAAREAGADRVLARSRFVQELPALLSGAVRQP
ncbi:MAG: response regulator [Longimicrobiales bacterium]